MKKSSSLSKEEIQKEWNLKGLNYAKAVNEMVAFTEKNGWDSWKGEEAEDERAHLAKEIIKLLKTANQEDKVAEFREDFPPSHEPLISVFDQKSISLHQFHFIEDQKIVFLSGAPYEERTAYILDEDRITTLAKDITAIGKSKRNNIFAIATPEKISTSNGWAGQIISEFERKQTANIGITELIPFNDGKKVLLVTSEGIFLISSSSEQLIHPINEDNEDNWTPDIDMENATLSHDNNYIVVGDQALDHRILDAEGNQIGQIGPQSSYPHYCLFSKDDTQLITNSCHFYNGVTIGVSASKLNGIKIEAYEESDEYIEIDDSMRVYTGVSTKDYYILGDAYGYIKAFDKKGKMLWRHFLGGTISGMTLSDDEKTLWVGSYSGMLHKLTLGKGHRDLHTIGNANHFEEFRLLIWKNEPQIWKW
ncbi:MAG: hypothetical protein MUE53_05175 [Chitinophagales bacterium]|jgi:hypothetical protein|nr:hypothetical protein [Chitinophagales bacterium]